MISQNKFESVKRDHGRYASWAVWANFGVKPKDNMGDLSIFEVPNVLSLLGQLNPNVILVGLNISKTIDRLLANFHGPNGGAYKIRYALSNSPFWGAYMTDIIKDFEQKVSGEMMSYLTKSKLFEEENISRFRKELRDIGSNKPKLIAFGRDAHTVLKRNFNKDEYEIVKIPHYSNYISKEKYREEVKSILKF